MNGKIIACAVSIICLLSIFTFGQSSRVQNIFNINPEPFGFEILNSRLQYQPVTITEDIAYEHLFRLISSFEKRAEKQLKEGRSQRARFLGSYLQRQAGLTPEQADALKADALRFTSELGCRSNPGAVENKDEKYNPEQTAIERRQMLLEYRNRVRLLLGESGFDKFNKFVQEKIASRLTYSRDSSTRVPLFSMSMVDYDYEANEVLGYSSTDEPSGHCQSVTNIVNATLMSDTEGIVDSGFAEVCDGGAEVYLYLSKPLPDDRICVDGTHEYAVTYYQWRSGVNSQLFNKARRQSTEGFCYYEKTYSLPPSEDCLITPPLPNVTSVTYQLIQPGATGIDTNPNAEGGQRIFPDKDTPGDTVNRQLIRVTAQVSENQSGIPIYFGNFDLDDPSSDATIDPNGNTGDDNLGNVNGNRAGQLSAVSAVTNGNGQASVNFTVTRQPGDNFAIAASVNQNAVSSVTINGTSLIGGSGASIDTNCDGTDLVCRSEMLTVWRRLNMEVDSMGEGQQNFVLGNFAESARIGTFETDVQVNTSQPLDPNRFENGRLVSGSRILRVTGNTTTSVRVRVFSGGTVRINQSETFQLFDDDDFDNDDGASVDGDTGEDITEPVDSLLQSNDTPCSDTVMSGCNVFAPAYIRPVRITADFQDNSIFQANVTENTGVSIRSLFVDFDQHLFESSTEFWTVYLYGGYQYTTDRDEDPESETGIYLGVSDAQNGVGSMVLKETNGPKECPEPGIICDQAETAAHEIGHLANADHNEGGLMDDVSYSFSPTSLRNIRNSTHP